MTDRKRNRDAIEAEIDRIGTLRIDALRQEWRSAFGTFPQDALTKDLLARSLTYRLQEESLGGLDRHLAKQLDRLARGGPSSGGDRQLRTGTVLVRDHGGQRHSVTVVADGFAWNGRTYSSLSGIARAITGTAWNGPRFFGMRETRGESRNEPDAERKVDRNTGDRLGKAVPLPRNARRKPL